LESDPEDPYLWLEDIDSAAALAWVHAQSAQCRAALEEGAEFQALRKRLFALYTATDRIPMVSGRGGLYYNFWQDAQHPRGLWRRIDPTGFLREDPPWDVLLDLDSLGRLEDESWVFSGAQCLFPEYTRALISLSRGGGDAHVVREFDLTTRQFVPDGFALPEAKGSIGWIDFESVYVATDFGPESLTDSGYPREVREWRRGTPLDQAALVFRGHASDVGVNAWRVRDWVDEQLVWRDFVVRQITTLSAEHYLRQGGGLVRLDLPPDASFSTHGDQLLVNLRSQWRVRVGQQERLWPAGALLAIAFESFLAGERDFNLLYEPGPRRSLAELVLLRHAIIVHELDDLKSRASLWRHDNGRWSRIPMSLPEGGKVSMFAVDADQSDACFRLHASPLTPWTLSIQSDGEASTPLKAVRPAFDARGMHVERFDVASRDGTRIPYSVTFPKGFTARGDAPTVLYAYGGFEHALLPVGYASKEGSAWLEKGGVHAIAGLRGGAEFGPDWHQAALRENRQRAYDDLIAVAEDLIDRRITSAAKLAISGRSNGGLLVGAVMVQRPELFGAVVCGVPLLDMRRYHKLLAGASWMGEYGDPDEPSQWAYMRSYSPYQNLRAGVRYPPIFLFTSTRDDRVHPGHARKMAAKMQALGARVLYFENTEGGHAASADPGQAAYMDALSYAFLLEELR
jgi:prolyl oligopeptidase